MYTTAKPCTQTTPLHSFLHAVIMVTRFSRVEFKRLVDAAVSTCEVPSPEMSC